MTAAIEFLNEGALVVGPLQHDVLAAILLEGERLSGARLEGKTGSGLTGFDGKESGGRSEEAGGKK